MSGETKQRINDLEAKIARLREAQPTLRDQFAMAVMPSVMTLLSGSSTIWAKIAYGIADEMLEARDAKN